MLVLGALLEAPCVFRLNKVPPLIPPQECTGFCVFCGFPFLASAMKLLWRLLLCDLLFCHSLLVFYIQCNIFCIKTMVVDFSNYGYEYDISQLLRTGLQKSFSVFLHQSYFVLIMNVPRMSDLPSLLIWSLWGLSLYDCCFWVFGTTNLPYWYQVKLN